MSKGPRVLLFGAGDGLAGLHLPRHLARVGIASIGLGGKHLLLMQSRHLAARLRWAAGPQRVDFLPLVQAVARWQPDWIIPVDEAAGRFLSWIGEDLLPGQQQRFPPALVELVARSLGNRAAYGPGLRARCQAWAQAAGIDMPAQATAASAAEVIDFARRHGYPVVLKAEESCGGLGVTIWATEAELRAAWAAYEKASGAGAVVQAHAPGRLAMHAVFAVGGKVLADLSAFQVQRRSPKPTAPSSVVELCTHGPIADAARRFTAAAGLSGFHAWDFLVDDGGRATLIEHNPRPIAIAHLGHWIGRDLLQRFAEHLGTPGRPRSEGDAQNAARAEVALFPDEWLRDPQSRYLQSGPHDAPWDDIGVLTAVTKSRGVFV